MIHEERGEPSLAAVCAVVRRDVTEGLLQLWGRSTVIDEHVGQAVIASAVFEALHEAAGLDEEFPEGNAGLLHVYGYWFSDVLTPFGRKRDRWVDGALAAALGRDRRAFHLDADDDTSLLERVTEATLPVLLDPPRAAVLVEQPVGDHLTRVVVQASPDGLGSALIYGVDGGSGFRLITAFPVAGDGREVLADFSSSAQLRWNAASRPT
ncbi:amino acid deaminase [Microbacterium oryzae]|uniref:amino acid deaminase n=1 Tax=Microbacterium oryzae TaxID=743009 RepID=UPI0025AEEFB8|nr:amino acid deaminase [Microbacterium oryzae]MDN3310300.1 amino acid deaminase [Microbacterium oryzae]